ncbi:TBC1 domain family member 16 [Halotydeus destructor]|nr:TBC1 domain family member 16 [Halotydeus destructor]
MAKLGDIIQKASSLWSYWSLEDKSIKSIEEGEIIFCKNNVCVHNEDGVHLPGYFNIRVHKFLASANEALTSTLILTWIPNSFIESNPRSIDQTPSSSPYRIHSIHRSPSMTSQESTSSLKLSRRQSMYSIVSSGENSQVNPHEVASALNSFTVSGDKEKKINLVITNDGGRQSLSPSLSIQLKCPFRHSLSPISTSRPLSGVFSVDLKQMKSLRLFFASHEGALDEFENNNTCGQLVIASRECQFKVFHFHYGGLDKLVSVLEQWHFLQKSLTDRRNVSAAKDDGQINCYHFSVSRPLKLTDDECHPEENIYYQLDEDTFFNGVMNEEGEVVDILTLRKIVFFSGIQQVLKKHVWPFLLERYNYSTTKSDRERISEESRYEYSKLSYKRLNFSQEEQDEFWKLVECTVDKDVPRTDRTNPYFAGDTNENINVMRRILLNFAIHNPDIGYTQGMSDLLAPILAEMQDESEAFWCFVGMMEKTSFVSSPKDVEMDHNLRLLRELIRVMLPKFYKHLQRIADGLELLFSHRWLLLCFKREFAEKSSLRMWEACWTRYQTDHFNLFICLAIMNVYGQDVLDQDMKTDEILFHFSTLSMHMNGDLVLRKARGLLYQYRLRTRIPCTLSDLCCPLGSENWDSSFAPLVECVSEKESAFDKCQC